MVNFPSNTLGGTGFTSETEAGAGITLGFVMSSSEAGWNVTGIRWWEPTGSRTVRGYLYSNDGVELASSAATAVVAGWNTLTLTTPYTLGVGELVLPAVYQATTRAYAYKAGVLASGVSSAPFSIAASKGRFRYGTPAGLDDANSNTSAAWFGVDAVLEQAAGEAKTTTAALGVSFTLSATATSQQTVTTTAQLGLAFGLAAVATSEAVLPVLPGGVRADRIIAGGDEVRRLYAGDRLLWAASGESVPQQKVTTGLLEVGFALAAVASSLLAGETIPGWLRTSGNTGLAGVGLTEGDLDPYSGSPSGGVLTINSALEGRIIELGTNQLRLNAPLTNCLVRSARVGGQGAIFLNGPNAAIIESDVLSTVTSGNETIGIYGSSTDGFQMLGSKVLGFTIGAWLDGASGNAPSLIEDSLIVTHVGSGSAHKDGFTRRSGMAPLSIRRTRIDTSGASVTGAVFIQPTWGGTVGNVRFEECYLEGAGYVVTLETATSMQFVGNRFRSTEYGPSSRTGQTSLTWADNWLYAASPPEYKGAAVT